MSSIYQLAKQCFNRTPAVREVLSTSRKHVSDTDVTDVEEARTPAVREVLSTSRKHVSDTDVTDVEEARNLAHQVAMTIVVLKVDEAWENEYQEWLGRLRAAASLYPGFYSVESTHDDQDNHVNILMFENQEKADVWLKSDTRSELVTDSERFYNVRSSSSVSVDTTKWGILPKPSEKQTPIPMWKNFVVIFTCLYPTIVFNRLVSKRLLFLLPGAASIPEEFTGFALTMLTVLMMTFWVVPAGFKLASKFFFPKKEHGKTIIQLLVLFLALLALAAAQNTDARKMILGLFVRN